MPRGCKWIDKGHFCKHTHRAMHKNIFKGTRHFVSVDRFETHAELLYKSIVTNKMALSIFRHHTCFYRSRRLLSLFSKGITSALPKQSSKAKLPNHAQTLLHPQTLLCYKHPVFSTDFMCLPHTLISYLGTAMVPFELADACSLRALCKPLLLPSTASKDWLNVLASSKRLFNSPGGHNFAKADTHI